MVLNIQRS